MTGAQQSPFKSLTFWVLFLSRKKVQIIYLIYSEPFELPQGPIKMVTEVLEATFLQFIYDVMARNEAIQLLAFAMSFALDCSTSFAKTNLMFYSP